MVGSVKSTCFDASFCRRRDQSAYKIWNETTRKTKFYIYDIAGNSLDRNESLGSELPQTNNKLATNEQGTATFLSQEVQEKEEATCTPTEFQQHAKVAQLELLNLRFDIEQFKEKDPVAAFYTGFPNFKKLMLCYDLVGGGFSSH